MARRMVGDGQELYRVIIVRRERRDNPDWERGNISTPRSLYDGEEFAISYGPYNSIGAARGQLTRETVDLDGSQLEGVADGWIEKARITWTQVQ